MFCDYQVNLGNSTKIVRERGDIQYFREGGQGFSYWEALGVSHPPFKNLLIPPHLEKSPPKKKSIPPTKKQFSCYHQIKAASLAEVIAPVSFLFSYSLDT